jgi:hypothetical protein
VPTAHDRNDTQTDSKEWVMVLQASAPGTSEASGTRRRVAPLIAGSVLAVFAVTTLIGGAWALWVDRMDRHDGYVSIGTTNLHTETSAIQAPLTGDGPDWLYGRKVFGTARVHATSQHAQPMFIGIARTRDVDRYLAGTGYATIQHLASDEVKDHAGRAQTVPPTRVSNSAASTKGTGPLTLQWKPRGGDWSIVLMNSDASPGVALHGSLNAKAPILPWLASGLLFVGAVMACGGALLIVRGVRRNRPSASTHTQPPQATTSTQVPVGAPS